MTFLKNSTVYGFIILFLSGFAPVAAVDKFGVGDELNTLERRLRSYPKNTALILCGFKHMMGTVPDCLKEFTCAKRILLGHNNLTGDFPDIFSHIPGLHYCALGRNRITSLDLSHACGERPMVVCAYGNPFIYFTPPDPVRGQPIIMPDDNFYGKLVTLHFDATPIQSADDILMRVRPLYAHPKLSVPYGQPLKVSFLNVQDRHTALGITPQTRIFIPKVMGDACEVEDSSNTLLLKTILNY